MKCCHRELFPRRAEARQRGGWLRWPALLLSGLLAIGPASAPLAALEIDVRRDATVEAIEKVMPSVVNIATATIVEYHDFYDNLLRQFYGLDRPAKRREQLNSIGSGVIIDEEGYVLTNLHVLRRASRVQVKLWDGRIFEADPLAATPGSDVALLKLRSKPGEKFKAVRFAADDDLLLGETVLALGNPYGLGESVSRGILSSKNRRPPAGDEPLNIADWLQTDAAINPGNSGGPLINLRGDLIGLNVAVYEGQGIGFAIPIKQVSAALSQFFSPEVRSSLWFGARIKAGTAPLVITAVQPGSPADKAGLRTGQQILQINGKPPKGLVDFSQLVAAAGDGSITLHVGQNAERFSVKVKLIPFDDLIRQKLGLGLANLTRETAGSFRVNPGGGLLIEEVEKNSPADRAQLKRGYLLTGIDGQNTGELWNVANVLTDKKSGEQVQLTIIVPRRLGASRVELRQGTASVQVR